MTAPGTTRWPHPEDVALERTLALTEAMLAAAEDGHWDRVDELETERSRLLPRSGAKLAEADDAGDLSRTLARLVALNRELLGLACAERDGCRDQLSRVNAGQRAGAAYRDASA